MSFIYSQPIATSSIITSPIRYTSQVQVPVVQPQVSFVQPQVSFVQPQVSVVQPVQQVVRAPIAQSIAVQSPTRTYTYSNPTTTVTRRTVEEPNTITTRIVEEPVRESIIYSSPVRSSYVYTSPVRYTSTFL